MHVTVLHNDLAAAVAAASTALPSRPAHPVLGAMLLETGPVTNRMRISAYDYETSATATLNVTLEEEGRVAVSGRLLSQIAKLLPKKPVDLRTDDNVLTIVAGRSEFTLPLLAVEDFPRVPEVGPSDFDGRVHGPEFASAVAYANVAAAKDDGLAARQMLTGILLEVADGTMQVVATDSHRIHWTTLDFDNDGEGGTFSALVPAKVLSSVAPAMAPDLDGVMLSMREMFGIDGHGLQRTTALIAAQFPPYRKVFSRTAVGTLAFDSAELVAALRRASALHDTKHVRLEPTDDDTVIIRTTDMADGSAVEEIDAEMAGDPPAVSLNGGFLADAVAGVKNDRITLTMTGAETPIYGNLGGNPQFAVMPVRNV